MMFISGLDDLFIDVIYWCRRVIRAVTVYRRHQPMDHRTLYQPDEKPLAIMVPAWNETGVIGNMAELAAMTLDYENYHIFVGTYLTIPTPSAMSMTSAPASPTCIRWSAPAPALPARRTA